MQKNVCKVQGPLTRNTGKNILERNSKLCKIYSRAIQSAARGPGAAHGPGAARGPGLAHEGLQHSPQRQTGSEINLR